MSIFDMSEANRIGTVNSVDTANVVIHVEDAEQLSRLQVNHLVVIRASKVGECLVGFVNKIVRKIDDGTVEQPEFLSSIDYVKVNLVGTMYDRYGTKQDVFKRSLDSVPAISADCFILSDEELTRFMAVISNVSAAVTQPLNIGNYAIKENAIAYIDGNKLFQRHAVITGSTGSGKSYTVATIVEQIAALPSCNIILFDIHGEYKPLRGDRIQHLKVAGPSDQNIAGVLFLPYWLLTYDEMLSLLIDRSDMNAPNQAMLFKQFVIECKQSFLDSIRNPLVFTIDSPIPYSIEQVIGKLTEKNTERVEGAKGGDKGGDYFGKLSRFIMRLQSKLEDRRLNFMFSSDAPLHEYAYMEELCKAFLASGSNGGGVKIIDFSEVPSDILPLIVSLVARIVFSLQQWTEKALRHPIALLCDEAHLYIPNNGNSSEVPSLISFERIAKEGRKYGVGLVVISQRPSEVNRTILSQCNNFIAMRLTNADDQNVIKHLLPDNIGSFADLLPILDTGEAIVVGDASLLPSRIRIKLPSIEPDSATIDFWSDWSKEESSDYIGSAVEALRKQSRN